MTKCLREDCAFFVFVEESSSSSPASFFEFCEFDRAVVWRNRRARGREADEFQNNNCTKKKKEQNGTKEEGSVLRYQLFTLTTRRCDVFFNSNFLLKSDVLF